MSAMMDQQLLAIRRSQAPALTPLDVRTLGLLADGCTRMQLARKMNVSFHVAKARCLRVYKKMGAVNAAQAVAMGYQMGYLKLDEWKHQ